MPLAEPAAPIVPIPAADALLVELLRAGLECYVRGDYDRAINCWLDAAAVAPTRPDAHAWITHADQLGLLLHERRLRTRPLGEASALRRAM